ncbi:MAG: hypothetical protein PHR06_10620, partial [Candidatus Cloacimonetes bacterium]|nr:hypothetical protein [Candidatus Cloacimonadota bacterium]
MKKFTFIGLLVIFTFSFLLAGQSSNTYSAERNWIFNEDGFLPEGAFRDSVVKAILKTPSHDLYKNKDTEFEMRKTGEAVFKNEPMDFYQYAVFGGRISGTVGVESYYYDKLICVFKERAYAFPSNLNLFIKDTGIVGDSLAIKDLCEIFLKNWFKGRIEIDNFEYIFAPMVSVNLKQFHCNIWTEINGNELKCEMVFRKEYESISHLFLHLIKTNIGDYIENKRIEDIPRVKLNWNLTHNDLENVYRAKRLRIFFDSDSIHFSPGVISSNDYFKHKPVVLNNNSSPLSNRTVNINLSDYDANQTVTLRITITSTNGAMSTIMNDTQVNVNASGTLSHPFSIPANSDTGIAKITAVAGESTIDEFFYLCNTLTGTLPNSGYGYKVYYCNYYSDFNQTAADEIAGYTETALINVYIKMVGQWQFASPQATEYRGDVKDEIFDVFIVDNPNMSFAYTSHLEGMYEPLFQYIGFG